MSKQRVMCEQRCGRNGRRCRMMLARAPHPIMAMRSAREGTLEGGIRMGDNLKKKKHPVL